MRIGLALLLTIVTGCVSAGGRSAAGPSPAAHPGFDISRYPGAEALRVWRSASPYRWVGFYLPAPCHRDASWSGRRSEIEAMGYGTAVLYVGQQQFEGDTTIAERPGPVVCSRTLLTAERGHADAADAAARTEAEGFPKGTAVFLDVERVSRLTPELTAYVQAWFDEVRRDGRYRPAIYAHRDNAAALHRLVAGTTDSVPLWVAGGAFALDRRPQDSGVEFASVWQGPPAPRTWGGVTLVVDENVAASPSPSAP